MTRSDILKKADDIINGERQTMYGRPEHNFGLIGELWTAYLGREITPHDVALMMALFKIARCKTGVGSNDSYVDACGYLAIGGEIFGDEMEKYTGAIDKLSRAMNAMLERKEESDETSDKT